MTTAAIVTGAGRGIGRAIALGLAEKGVATLCISRTASCENTSEEIRRRSGTSTSLMLDLADYDRAENNVRAWVDTTVFDRCVVVLAAAQLGPRGPLAESQISDWDNTFRANVLGNLAVLKGSLDRMLESRFGRIVFLAGGGAAYEFPQFPAYAATKTALVRIVENLAIDLRNAGDFSVVCLAPGAIETDMLAEVHQAGAKVRTRGRVEDSVAFVSSFLAAPGAPLSGRFIHVKDEWERFLTDTPDSPEQWKLRRVE